MILRLYHLIISETEGLKKGAYLGQVTLSEGTTIVEVGDPDLKSKLEDLFSKPIQVRTGGRVGTATVDRVELVQPNTPEFFKAVYYELRNVWNIYPEIASQ